MHSSNQQSTVLSARFCALACVSKAGPLFHNLPHLHTTICSQQSYVPLAEHRLTWNVFFHKLNVRGSLSRTSLQSAFGKHTAIDSERLSWKPQRPPLLPTCSGARGGQSIRTSLHGKVLKIPTTWQTLPSRLSSSRGQTDRPFPCACPQSIHRSGTAKLLWDLSFSASAPLKLLIRTKCQILWQRPFFPEPEPRPSNTTSSASSLSQIQIFGQCHSRSASSFYRSRRPPISPKYTWSLVSLTLL